MMKYILSLYIAACLFAGCATVQPRSSPTPLASDVVYAHVQAMPIPLPERTPYDYNYESKTAYSDGFGTGWKAGAQPDGLGAFVDSPYELTSAARAAWREGFRTGHKAIAEEIQASNNALEAVGTEAAQQPQR